MENVPPVSIYIITYLTSEARCAVLRRTCEVALEQDYPEFEVVVSDNGGEFSAVDALESIQDSRLKVHRFEENVGFAGNMNRCMELCRHDIIKPCCDDDLIHKHFLRSTLPFLEDDTLVIVDREKFPFGQEPDGLTAPVLADPVVELRAPGYGQDIWKLPYEPWIAAMLFTRNFFHDIGGFDRKTITADWDFIVDVAIHRPIRHVKSPLCFIGEWPESLTVSMQQTNPYFYPHSELYTYFRVLKNKSLSAEQKREIKGMLFKGFVLQSLRPLRHPLNKPHWKGYHKYFSRYMELLQWKCNDFSSRPGDTINNAV